MNPRERGYSRLVRASAWYDLVVTAGFATPWTFALVHRFLSLGGAIPAFQPLHVLIANLFGVVVLVWVWIRLRDPAPIYGLYDASIRTFFLVWMLWYLSTPGSTPLAWIFPPFELAFALAQGLGWLWMSGSTSRKVRPETGLA